MPSLKQFQSFQFSTVPPHETTHFTITTMTTGTNFSKEHSSEIQGVLERMIFFIGSDDFVFWADVYKLHQI